MISERIDVMAILCAGSPALPCSNYRRQIVSSCPDFGSPPPRLSFSPPRLFFLSLLPPSGHVASARPDGQMGTAGPAVSLLIRRSTHLRTRSGSTALACPLVQFAHSQFLNETRTGRCLAIFFSF